MGLRVPTAVQAACLPALLRAPAGGSDEAAPRGPDCIACAPTGTGKTAAFALPVLQRLSEDPFGIMCLVLTPARELAFQIAEQLAALGAPLGARVAPVTGGTDQVRQTALVERKPHVVVATPGRLAHLLSTASAARPDLSRLAFLVLDECDRLLDESFSPDFAVILAAAEPSAARRQTLLFSATVTPEVRALETLHRFGVRRHDLFEFGLGHQISTDSGSGGGGGGGADTGAGDDASGAAQLLAPVMSADLRQEYLFVPAAVKNAYLWQLLLTLGPDDLSLEAEGVSASSALAPKRRGKKGKAVETSRSTSGGAALGAGAAARAETEAALSRARSVIIFAATCRNAQLVCEMCVELGIPATALHSVLPQAQRLASIAKFKAGRVRVLVSTDVGSRGLDLPSVDLVINYDVPRLPSDYVHRAGRTARAGRGGRCITIVSQYEVALLQTIERVALGGRQLASVPMATVCPEDKVLQRLTKVSTALHLARARLVDTGIEETLLSRKQRRNAAL